MQRSKKAEHKFRVERASDLIAELYYLCDRNRTRIQEELVARGMNLNGGRTLDEILLYHPLIRRLIVAKAREMQKMALYTREQHLKNLQKIRDGALADENWKVGLAAEVAVGRAAGLYESFDPNAEDEKKLMPPENMSNDQLRERLAKLQQRSLPAPSDMGAPVQQGSYDPSDLPMGDRPF